MFVDESGCDTRAGFRKTGWSPKGVTPKDITALQRSARFSILPAYNVEGVLYSEVYTGTTDAERFLTFCEHLVSKCDRYPLPNSVVVMDNASIHHSEEVEALFARAGVRLVYLPPYSPDFNPIEEYFSQLKAFIKRDFSLWEEGSFETFEGFLEYCVQITGSDVDAAKGHFRSAYIDLGEL